YTKDIDEVFELVKKGKAVYGIIPIENKLHGTIRETLDALFHENVYIDDEIKIPVHHFLFALKNTKKRDIKRILSHSQALNQCKKYLKKNFPEASLEAFSSTAFATEKLLKSKSRYVAVIAPEIAEENKKLKILDKNIEDKKGNSTIFIVIKKGNVVSKKGKKTSVAFHFSKDSPGSLFTVFKDFADAGINLTKIESRPTKARFGDYIFYLDFEGGTSDPKIRRTLRNVEKKVAKLKILGSY
ncbi:prephenate dehydratase, partial [Candidatus Peregrinibacteria bacterium]|nr:prephenate dehydratase [Candidatus Peregrinibacteria bacterium]